tara:strand:+ start:248 stop:412 length:165 start_codon:yes stop_codon:yes gene_type:complete
MRRLSRPHLGALPVKIYFRARDITFRVLGPPPYAEHELSEFTGPPAYSPAMHEQ